jgi:hypothetical protein
MKKRISLLLCIFSVLHWTCKKENEQVDCGNKSSLPATIINENAYEVAFDEAGNLTWLYYDSAADNPHGVSYSDTYEFLRSENEIRYNYTYHQEGSSPTLSKYFLKLDQQGRCAAMKDTWGDTIYLFAYNNDGYLAATYFKSFGVPDTGRFEYQDGNLVRYTSLNISFDFEYSTDTDDSPWYFQNLPLHFSNLEWAIFLNCFGKKNKNMLNRAKLVSKITGTTEYNYSYQYDPCGRLVQWGGYGFKYSD